ncbi:MAG TPA: hypothetical protein VGV38_04880 [Pyrinomonadaceae bacterium]|nr:hypothetical protein [Pyrinomonadaceae bacterium]
MKRRNLVLSFLLAASLSSLPRPAQGRAVMPSLEALAKSAKVIVVAQVEKVVDETPEGGAGASGVRDLYWERRVASARVLEVWKGTADERVRFRASRTWSCDVSTAVKGETVVLFLVDDPKDTLMAIAYSGIGRLPVVNNEGRPTVHLYRGLLTKEIKKLIGVPEETFASHVDVALLRQQVQQLAQANTSAAK